MGVTNNGFIPYSTNFGSNVYWAAPTGGGGGANNFITNIGGLGTNTTLYGSNAFDVLTLVPTNVYTGAGNVSVTIGAKVFTLGGGGTTASWKNGWNILIGTEQYRVDYIVDSTHFWAQAQPGGGGAANTHSSVAYTLSPNALTATDTTGATIAATIGNDGTLSIEGNAGPYSNSGELHFNDGTNGFSEVVWGDFNYGGTRLEFRPDLQNGGASMSLHQNMPYDSIYGLPDGTASFKYGLTNQTGGALKLWGTVNLPAQTPSEMLLTDSSRNVITVGTLPSGLVPANIVITNPATPQEIYNNLIVQSNMSFLTATGTGTGPFSMIWSNSANSTGGAITNDSLFTYSNNVQQASISNGVFTGNGSGITGVPSSAIGPGFIASTNGFGIGTQLVGITLIPTNIFTNNNYCFYATANSESLIISNQVNSVLFTTYVGVSVGNLANNEQYQLLTTNGYRAGNSVGYFVYPGLGHTYAASSNWYISPAALTNDDDTGTAQAALTGGANWIQPIWGNNGIFLIQQNGAGHPSHNYLIKDSTDLDGADGLFFESQICGANVGGWGAAFGLNPNAPVNSLYIRADGSVDARTGFTNDQGNIQLLGTVQFPAYTTANGFFYGNGSGVVSETTDVNTNNASQLSSGTVADARLSTNVALLNRSGQTWVGSDIWTNITTGWGFDIVDTSNNISEWSGVTLRSVLNTNGDWYAQSFNGSGAGLTGILASSLTGQVAIANGGTGAATAAANTVFQNKTGSTAAPGFSTIASANLSDAANVALLNGNPQTFTGSNIFNGGISNLGGLSVAGNSTFANTVNIKSDVNLTWGSGVGSSITGDGGGLYFSGGSTGFAFQNGSGSQKAFLGGVNGLWLNYGGNVPCVGNGMEQVVGSYVNTNVTGNVASTLLFTNSTGNTVRGTVHYNASVLVTAAAGTFSISVTGTNDFGQAYTITPLSAVSTAATGPLDLTLTVPDTFNFTLGNGKSLTLTATIGGSGSPTIDLALWTDRGLNQ